MTGVPSQARPKTPFLLRGHFFIVVSFALLHLVIEVLRIFASPFRTPRLVSPQISERKHKTSATRCASLPFRSRGRHNSSHCSPVTSIWTQRSVNFPWPGTRPVSPAPAHSPDTGTRKSTPPAKTGATLVLDVNRRHFRYPARFCFKPGSYFTSSRNSTSRIAYPVSTVILRNPSVSFIPTTHASVNGYSNTQLVHKPYPMPLPVARCTTHGARP